MCHRKFERLMSDSRMSIIIKFSLVKCTEKEIITCEKASVHPLEKDFNYEENESRQNHVVVLSYNRTTTLIWQTEHLFSTHVGVSRFQDIDVIWIKAHFTTEDPTLHLYFSNRDGREK